MRYYRFAWAVMMVVAVTCVITQNARAQPVDVRFIRNSTTLFASVGRPEGTPDQFFTHWDPDEAFPGRRHLGFGHGNRAYQLRFFDLETISATREPGKRFAVTNAAFDTREGDQLQYEGGVEIAPILVDWVSNIVPATWNNIVGSGSGVPGHGATVQQGQRINSTQFLFPASGPPSPDFLQMIEDWLNYNSACQIPGRPNYGFLVKATASSPSSLDKHLEWVFTFTYEQVPDPLCPICGDGITDQGEGCDDGGESATCDSDCTLALCGDGTLNVTSGEACDDGTITNGDGCSILCVEEDGFFCTGMPSICALDCNANDVSDKQDISSGTSTDCNGNGVPDECDIKAETSADSNANGVPDECEPVEWSVADGGNGHFYEFVEAPLITWTDARAAAANRNFKGISGHLLTSTSLEENNFVRDLFANGTGTFGWIGASDSAAEGEYRWVEGPETGIQFWQGTQNGSVTPPFNFANWAGRDPTGGSEDFVVMGLGPFDVVQPGEWGDADNNAGDGAPIAGYFVEYSITDCNGNGIPDEQDPDCNGNGIPDSCSLGGMVYWTDPDGPKDGHDIWRSSPDGSGIETLVTGISQVSHPRGMAIDHQGGKMYWGIGSPATANIMRANLDGTTVEVFVPGTSAAGIAVDSRNGKVYWSDSVVIRRASLDGSNIETVVSEGLVHPVGIALDAREGKLYWTDLKGNLDGAGTINRADLDGSNTEILVSGEDEANGMAIDPRNGKIYWTELVTRTIRSANSDGTGVETIVAGLDTPTTVALDLIDDKMYWTDSGFVAGQVNRIQRSNFDGTGIEVIVSGVGFPWGIAFSRSTDCNENGIPDECDLADETSSDFNQNGVPDECDPDCDGNDIADFLDIALGFSNDCNGDEIPDQCQPPVIVSSEPRDGFIDARQDLSSSGTTPQGINRVRLTFADVVMDAKTQSELTPNSFTLVDTSGNHDILEVIAVDDVANTYEVVFVDPIAPGTWTTLMANVESECGVLANVDEGDRIDLGFLPGDVDSSGMPNALDILALIDSLNDVIPLTLEQTDINRSDVASAMDILRLIDLLNGANSTQPWNGVTLPARP